MLRDHILETKKEALRKGSGQQPEWLFYDHAGNALDRANIRNRYFSRCLEKAGLRQIRFHDLRHTFASLLIAQGESLAYVRDQLGHSSIQMTVDVYGHLVPGSNRAAVDRLDDPHLYAPYLHPEACSNQKGVRHCFLTP